jgi:uncharacterized protein with HEPN domain
MHDTELSLQILLQIREAAKTILWRFSPIHHVDDFTASNEGKEKLDAICMQLIAIGESLKKLDTVTKHSLLVKYPQIEWKRAMGLRDIITHHYFDINAEAIFDVCETKIKPLLTTIEKMIFDMQEEK